MKLATLVFALIAVSVQGKSLAGLGKNLKDAAADTHFNLWTRSNPIILQELFTGDAAGLASSHFDPSKPTKVFAHGWTMNGYNDPTVLALRDAFLQKEDCNYIAVDWQQLANDITYYPSAANTYIVGELTGGFINFLMSQGAALSSVHIIGFSLGAHVAGRAGATINGVAPRITGLDPAFPGFSLDNTDERLDTTDAAFVDVIHTNSARLVGGGLSFPHPIGHVDFWPNGGISQPGCAATGPDLIDLATGCSHFRAPIYFTESINSGTPFRATKCTTYEDWQAGLCSGNEQTIMGYDCPSSTSEEFFLDTNSEAPFALG